MAAKLPSLPISNIKETRSSESTPKEGELPGDGDTAWEDVVSSTFPAPYGAEYITTLKFHCMTLRDVVRCQPDDMRELKVRMGHRDKLQLAADRFDAKMARIDAAKLRFVRRTTSSLGAVAAADALSGRSNADGRRKSLGGNAERPKTISSVVTRGTDIEWIDSWGSSPSLEVFLDEMRGKLSDLGFPRNFHRFFLDNKPMPFADGDGTLVLGLLLRLPDLEAEDGGYSVTVITNRLVILLALDEGLVFTYHRGDLELVTLFRDTWEASDFKSADMGTMLEAILRRAFRTYEIAVNELREEMDEASTATDEVTAVQAFTLIQKKADVFERCVRASLTVLQDASEMEHCDGLHVHLRAMCDRLRTVQSLCEEVQSNALSAVDLNIALAEFRSSTNLKIFTYITILSQPIAVATSWYGMNWESMHELKDPNGYKIFVPTVLIVSFLLSLFLFLREQYLLRVSQRDGGAGRMRSREAKQELAAKKLGSCKRRASAYALKPGQSESAKSNDDEVEVFVETRAKDVEDDAGRDDFAGVQQDPSPAAGKRRRGCSVKKSSQKAEDRIRTWDSFDVDASSPAAVPRSTAAVPLDANAF